MTTYKLTPKRGCAIVVLMLMATVVASAWSALEVLA